LQDALVARCTGDLLFPPFRFDSVMTTLVAVRKNKEIAIAADSLTTFGDTRLSAQFDSTYDKIVHHKGTYIGLCGSAAHQLVFESLLAKHEDFDFSTKRAIFETFRKLHPILKEQHFLNPKEEEDDPYESTQVTALIANAAGFGGGGRGGAAAMTPEMRDILQRGNDAFTQLCFTCHGDDGRGLRRP